MYEPVLDASAVPLDREKTLNLPDYLKKVDEDLVRYRDQVSVGLVGNSLRLTNNIFSIVSLAGSVPKQLLKETVQYAGKKAARSINLPLWDSVKGFLPQRVQDAFDSSQTPLTLEDVQLLIEKVHPTIDAWHKFTDPQKTEFHQKLNILPFAAVAELKEVKRYNPRDRMKTQFEKLISEDSSPLAKTIHQFFSDSYMNSHENDVLMGLGNLYLASRCQTTVAELQKAANIIHVPVEIPTS